MAKAQRAEEQIQELDAEADELQFRFGNKCVGTDRAHNGYYVFVSMGGVYRRLSDSAWQVSRIEKDGEIVRCLNRHLSIRPTWTTRASMRC